MESKRGKVQTVSGLVEPEALSIVLPHEHLSHSLNGTIFCDIPPNHHGNLANCNFALENLWWIKQFPYSHLENLIFCDAAVHDAVIDEMKFFKQQGGGTIVDNTCINIGRNIPLMQKVTKETGVHVVAGTGYYVAASNDPVTRDFTEEAIFKRLQTDLTIGADNTGICCGVIGEIGCSWPLHDFEKKVLRAAAEVQEKIGCPVIIHPGRNENSPFEIMRIFTESGGKANWTVMSHLDRTIHEKTLLAEFASLGSFCEHDLFGIECSYYQNNPNVDMLSDGQRIKFLKYLVDQGFENKIVISQDLHTKHRLMKYGGHGYSHILLNVIPKMLSRGFSKEVVNKITCINPQTWLAYHK